MRPAWFTKKQSELLQLIYPAPIGEGLTVIEARERLGISYSAAFSRLRSFKKRFPKAWEQYQAALRVSQEHRKQLKYGASHGNGYETYNDIEIKEKF